MQTDIAAHARRLRREERQDTLVVAGTGPQVDEEAEGVAEPVDDDAALARRSAAREMAAAFHRTADFVRATFASIVEAERDLNLVFGLPSDSSRLRISPSWPTYQFDRPEDVIARMHREAWDVIVDRLEVRRYISIERAKKLDQQLAEGDLPEITEENILGFMNGYMSSLDEMLAEAIREVYDWLRPRYDEYKTNSQYEVGERVVLTGQAERYGKGYHIRSHQNARWAALENVFTALDGRGQVNKDHRPAIELALEAGGWSGRAKTDLFEVRAFKNGNVHLRFLRLDLLQRFNQVAGGARLASKPEDDPSYARRQRRARRRA
jgi:hypothetical protein